jgi:leader peptidase (prepilin peptidase)/N-methyltransferase
MTDPIVLTSLALFVGLCVGSFVNVVIHRVPKMLERGWEAQCADLRGETLPEAPAYNLVVPRSACPACGHKITALENIPLLSWLVLKGKCSACKAPISARYPVVELLGGLLAAFAIHRFGAGLQGFAACALLWTLLALTFIDLDTQLLPDDLTLPLLWAGLIVNLSGVFVPLDSAVIGAVAGYLSLWAVYWLFKLATGKEGMGYGDFKLLAAIGAWLGWKAILPVVLMASVIGAVVGIGMKLSGALREGRYVPFGPFLAGGGAAVILIGLQPVLAFIGWA